DQALADTLNNLDAVSDDAPPGVQSLIEPSDAVRDYLDANFSTDAEIGDVDGGGEISMGDRISYTDDQGIQQTVTIDQALADTLNALDQTINGDFIRPSKGIEGNLIQPSNAVRDYLDTNYSTDAEIGDADGDGKINVGDVIIDQGEIVVTIDQALADTLNSLDQTINGDFIRPSEGIKGSLIQPSNAVRDYLDTNYSTEAEIGDADGDGKINVGDVIIDQGEIVVTIDQALADELNTLGQNNDGVLLEAHH
ncbi:MAG: hypothetical protein V3U78_08395, partial [Thiotrichaceae bacterium]